MSRLGQDYASVENSISMMAQGAMLNGRVDLMSPLPRFNIPTYQQTSVNNTRYAQEATNGQLVVNEVSSLFFSEGNINALQDGIRYRVWVETNGKHTIGRQSDQELKIVMRSMYFQHSKNTYGDCVGQVRTLNGKVLDWVVPEVLSNLLQYSTYRKDASTLPMPLERAQLSTTKGTKVLEVKSFM